VTYCLCNCRLKSKENYETENCFIFYTGKQCSSLSRKKLKKFFHVTVLRFVLFYVHCCLVGILVLCTLLQGRSFGREEKSKWYGNWSLLVCCHLVFEALLLIWGVRGRRFSIKPFLSHFHVVHHILTNEAPGTKSWYYNWYMCRKCHYLISEEPSYDSETIMSGMEEILSPNCRLQYMYLWLDYIYYNSPCGDQGKE